MAINCAFCGSQEWCLWHNGDYYCKACFIDRGEGSLQDWNDKNAEAKARRLAKREGRAIEEYEENISQDYKPKQRTDPKEKAKPCNRDCGAMIWWDYSLREEKNKFRELDTNLQHTADRCKKLQFKNKKGGDYYNQ